MEYLNKKEIPILRKTFQIIVIIIAVTISLLGFYLNLAFYHDDAFITLRYARNFLNGTGIVWNPQEYVEGYTNFFFLMLVTLFGAIGIDLALASQIVNFLAFFALVAFISFFLPFCKKEEDRQRSLLPIPFFIFTITSFPMIVWTLGGLEGPLFAFLCTVGIWLSCEADANGSSNKYLVVSGLLLAFACLTRLDGLIYVGLTFIYLFWRKQSQRTSSILYFLLPLLCILIPHFLWRLSYYGALLPNTFYAKATGFDLMRVCEGLKYFFSYLISPPFVLLLLCIVIPYSIYRRFFDKKMMYILSTIVLYTAYIICLGGDHMPSFRLFLPVFSSSLLLLYMILKKEAQRFIQWRGFPACGAVLLLVALQFYYPPLNPRKMDPAAFIGTIVGKYVATAWPENSLIALNTSGSTPYYAPNHKFIDMLGLNDAHIAKREINIRQLKWQKVAGHEKGDGAYVLSRNPDYIIVGPAAGTTINKPWFLSDLEMSRDKRFYRNYKMRKARIPVEKIDGYERYYLTRSGIMDFTYYERVERD